MENTKYSQLFMHSQEGILTLNTQGYIQSVNPAIKTILGHETEKLLRQPLNILLDTPDKAIFEAIMHYCAAQRTYYNQCIFKKADGSLITVGITAFLTLDESNQIDEMVIILTDLTGCQIHEEQIAKIALYDQLTQLPNRVYFEKNLALVIDLAEQVKKQIGLLILDVDNFKDINDRLGHHIGDLLLISISKRLLSCLGEKDFFARTGSDEFTIILDHIMNEEEMIKVAQKILQALDIPFYLNTHEINITASIGIASYPLLAKTAALLAKNADIALDQAKQLGLNQYYVFNADLSQRVKSRLQISDSIKHALQRNEFELYYQPKIGLANKQVMGMEALLRWNRPHLGVVSPENFFDIAEKSQLITSLTNWVIEEAIRTNANLNQKKLPPCPIAINLSSLQLEHNNIVHIIAEALKKHALNPKLFEIELTETSLIDSTEKTLAILHSLHELGVTITIDDFGTGYSSLSYLKKLPLDQIKIDQEFVRGIGTNKYDAAIIKAIILLAHTLGLKVIAEGVETPSQLKFLQDQHCDQIQGYYISSPLSKDKLEVFLTDYNADKFFN